jgi:hypothetical protein
MLALGIVALPLIDENGFPFFSITASVAIDMGTDITAVQNYHGR